MHSWVLTELRGKAKGDPIGWGEVSVLASETNQIPLLTGHCAAAEQGCCSGAQQCKMKGNKHMLPFTPGKSLSSNSRIKAAGGETWVGRN